MNKFRKSKDKRDEYEAVSSTELMWPRDLLVPVFQKARIATYSYESKWTHRAVKTSLRQYTEQLLNILFQHS